MAIPLVDIGPLLTPGSAASRGRVGAELGAACRDHGFFYVVGHGIEASVFDGLVALSREFFAWEFERKLDWRMELGGKAWRGYFPVGAELTSGRADEKEGLYFGEELAVDDPRVRAGLMLHGPNLVPDVPGLRPLVLEAIARLTELGHALMEGLALGLGLDATYFVERITREPTTLFRVFHYPSLVDADPSAWSVAEHTDYGLLTMLHQDDAGGLEIHTGSGWISAPPIAGSLVCNIGDMLERMTAGHYRSTLHRVRNTSGRSRISCPFFFDPAFDARIQPIGARDLGAAPVGGGRPRWDGASVHAFEGEYGEYLIEKVTRVFPELARRLVPGVNG